MSGHSGSLFRRPPCYIPLLLILLSIEFNCVAPAYVLC